MFYRDLDDNRRALLVTRRGGPKGWEFMEPGGLIPGDAECVPLAADMTWLHGDDESDLVLREQRFLKNEAQAARMRGYKQNKG